MLAFMGGILVQGTRLKAHRPALAYPNVCLYVCSFIFFVDSAFWGKEMGVELVFALCCVVCLAR